jgi:hypothetical protein
MTKLLTVDEMLDVLAVVDPATYGQGVAVLEALGTMLANRIGEKLGVGNGPANKEHSAFAGTCAGFWPASEGQECPSPLNEYDPTEWGDD